MGKQTRKQASPRKPKHTLLSQSSDFLVHLAKTKLIRKCTPQHPLWLDANKISSLVTEEILTCSLCLQLLLSPVLAQCGHSFCLTCAEDLAHHGFACGICHSHHPTYDLQHSPTIQSLLEDYLLRTESEERELYQKRQVDLENKQKNRRLTQVQEGDNLDFWCDDQHTWKSGIVAQILKNGVLIITAKKGLEEVAIPSSSRKLAPHRHFTKEQSIQENLEVHVQPPHFIPGRDYDNMRIRMEERPRLFGMPLFMGYYWRGEDMLDPNGVFDHLDPFAF